MQFSEIIRLISPPFNSPNMAAFHLDLWILALIWCSLEQKNQPHGRFRYWLPKDLPQMGEATKLDFWFKAPN
jgi:hypothetical protein